MTDFIKAFIKKRTGLVLKDVQVHKNGKIYTAKRWVREEPTKTSDKPSKEKSGNTLTKPKKSDKIKKDKVIPDFLVGHSLGAKYKNYEIELPDGSTTNLTEGTKITKITVIAGKGRDHAVDILDLLLYTYQKSDPFEWTKVKGIGYVDHNGESREADLHWYEEPTVGKVKWKLKIQKGGNWFLDD